MTLAAAPVELLVDRYELTMAASYLAEGRADDRVAFELSVRELPRDRGYLLAAGLEQVVDYLRDLCVRAGGAGLPGAQRHLPVAAARAATAAALRRRPGRRCPRAPSSMPASRCCASRAAA